MAGSCWNRLLCSKSQLCLETVLVGGQSFRWKQNDSGEWLGVIAGEVWKLKQTNEHLLYQVHQPVSGQGEKNRKLPKNEKSDLNAGPILAKGKAKTERLIPKTRKKTEKCRSLRTEIKEEQEETDTKSTNERIEEEYIAACKIEADVLKDYFQLNVDLENLYSEWSSKDAHFAKIAHLFPGIRILRQDPVENLISFVCSSNNHISRITSMVEKLCTHYGDFITQVDGKDFYSFPTFKALSGNDVESTLRQLGFGYRAKFISNIAQHITQDKDTDWLTSLRDRKYPEAKAELMTLLGVGAKVADCVCLMSLDKSESVPVDTHVWQFTMKNYMAKLQTAKSLTDRLYREIGDFYRNLWGPYAGWAHSVLFIADLKQNKDKVAGKHKAQDKGEMSKSRQKVKKTKL